MTVLFSSTPHIKVAFSPGSQSNPLVHYLLIWVVFIERDLFLCLFFIKLKKNCITQEFYKKNTKFFKVSVFDYIEMVTLRLAVLVRQSKVLMTPGTGVWSLYGPLPSNSEYSVILSNIWLPFFRLRNSLKSKVTFSFHHKAIFLGEKG